MTEQQFTKEQRKLNVKSLGIAVIGGVIVGIFMFLFQAFAGTPKENSLNIQKIYREKANIIYVDKVTAEIKRETNRNYQFIIDAMDKRDLRIEKQNEKLDKIILLMVRKNK